MSKKLAAIGLQEQEYSFDSIKVADDGRDDDWQTIIKIEKNNNLWSGLSLVSIIILNYNAGQLLLDCVESIMKTNYDNFEVIIVDNASMDQSHRKCKEKFENVRLIETGKN